MFFILKIEFTIILNSQKYIKAKKQSKNVNAFIMANKYV